MRSSYLYFLILISFGIVSSCNEKEDQSISLSEEFDARMQDKLYPMDDHFWAKNYPDGKFSRKAFSKAIADIRKGSNVANARVGAWRQEGPGNIGGRINTIAVNPSDPSEIMLGYSQGGVFKTTDDGSNWYPIFDDQDILSISDIAYDPNNNQTIFVGTGDLNITGTPATGNGIFKSENGGATWVKKGLVDAGVIAEVHVARSNSNLIYAASMGLPYERTSDRGLYRSDDAGESWEQILYLNDSTGVIDIEVHPEDPQIVYAATWTRIRNNRESVLESEDAAIYKTNDGGATWSRLSEGLPSGRLVRPGLSLFESNPDVIYSSFVHYNSIDSICSVGYQLEGLYKTSDAGMSWSEVPTTEESGLNCSILGGFGWYFGQIRVHPENEDEVYILGVDMARTVNGGLTWDSYAPPWWTYEVHADKHDLVFDNGMMYLATDGGAYRFPEGGDPFYDWQDIENIVSTQFYRVAVSPFDEGAYYGGAQDNGSTGGNEEEIDLWSRIFGGDGFQMIFHPVDPNIWYVETQNGNIRITLDGGGSYQSGTFGLNGTRNWDMQYIMSSVDPNMLYTGTNKIFRSISSTEPFWIPISDNLIDTLDLSTATSHNITTLDESPDNPDILYCGTSDGFVWRSMDFGVSWENITGNLPRRYVSDVKASRSDASTVYVSIQGYKDNDFTPYIYRSKDNGDTWEQINGDLPQIAINDILLPEDDDDDQEVFIATDGGVFYTRDEGVSWVRLGEDMPIMPIYDLALNNSNELVAGSFARGIYTFDLSQLEESATSEEKAQKWLVFPSVSSTVVNVKGLTEATEIEVISSTGQVMYKAKIDGTLNIADLPTGLFYLRSQTGIFGKFIKI